MTSSNRNVSKRRAAKDSEISYKNVEGAHPRSKNISSARMPAAESRMPATRHTSTRAGSSNRPAPARIAPNVTATSKSRGHRRGAEGAAAPSNSARTSRAKSGRATSANATGKRVPKHSPSANSRNSKPLGGKPATSVLSTIGQTVVLILSSLAHAIARGFLFLFSKSKVAALVILTLCVWLVIYGGLTLATGDKIYDRIQIGDVDVSGMTMAEAASAVSSKYESSVADNSLYIFASNDLAENADIQTQIMQQEALDEQISFEDARQNKQLWIATADSSGATLDSWALAQAAYEAGRNKGFFGDLLTRTFGSKIELALIFDSDTLESFLVDIDDVIGSSTKASGVNIEGTHAVAYSGQDGNIVDRAQFKKQLSTTLLESDGSADKWVAEAVYAQMPVTYEAAQQAADIINQALEVTPTFQTGETYVKVSTDKLATWIKTNIAYTDENNQSAETAYILPWIDSSVATSDIVALVNGDTSSSVAVTFTKNDEGIFVTPAGEITIPAPEEAIATLNQALFGSFEDLASSGKDASNAVIDTAATQGLQLATKTTSDAMTLQDALDLGVVSVIANYTTQFSETSSTVNRTHNINLISQMLDSYIVPSGGQWSFNDQAGACDESQGFKAAGAISGGEYVDDIGGGVCQVATTIFNAVYNAGLEVVERHNHSLYIASYPAGRDAAIAYPYLDLVWNNDTSSDVLVQMTTGTGWVDCALIGVSPNRTVTTETGEWQEGESYSLRIDTDDTIDANSYYTKTAGTDGSQISVTRKVYSSGGDLLMTDVFSSVYDPVTEVIKAGTSVDTDALYAEKTAQMSASKSKSGE